jgi:hypothetical protein
MKELCRKTLELFRTNPILWIPYVCAELSTYVLSWFDKAASKRIMNWAMTQTQHSVLGGETQTFDTAGFAKGALLSTPIKVGTPIANFLLYMMAFVVTASLVSAILADRRPNLSAAVSSLRAYPRNFLLFFLKFCLVEVVVSVPYVAAWLLVTYTHLGVLISPSFLGTAADTYVWPPLIGVCVTWFFAPMAITLLRPSGEPALAEGQMRLGRYAAMIGVGATFVIQYLVRMSEKRVTLDSNIEWTVLHAFNSLLINFPFILIFIALALVAAEEAQEETNNEPSLLQKLARIVMPMHFRASDEVQADNQASYLRS